ncbi:Uncharacterised protein [Rhodococcus gordoniae]|uniref:Toxin-antitoxin system HicB family antitoxin n=1 Tax=Rhodococcus gordoniae TaxID=223392 RepID=A0A379LUE2_9NOCA|nr:MULTISPECIES: hypothetical protein [Rhodococcus]UTT50244.1 hypothetical protein NMQ04_08795 [Rhodococcus gordoniae]SUE13664.1 Uncharacterised protein [Rhodococcus gordoniae]
MDIDKYTSAITDSVIAAAELGDEQTRRTAAALATAIAAPVRLAVLAALSDMANEVSDELGDRTVTVRLDGTDAVLAVHSEPAAPHEDPTPSFEEMTGDISRVTLRLVEQIKTKAEEAAQQSGLSLNSWMAQAVQGALREQMRYQRRADEWRRRGGWAEPTPPAPSEQQPSERHDTTGPDDTAGRDDTGPRADT